MADVALDANVVVGLLDKEDSLNARARELVRAVKVPEHLLPLVEKLRAFGPLSRNLAAKSALRIAPTSSPGIGVQ